MAADLDGVGDFYSVTPTLGDDFTLMGWFRADTFTGFSCPFGRGNTTNQMLILNNSSGVLQLDINLASNQGSTLTTGVWNHLAVRRGETGANDFEFFLNGVLDITTTNAITLVDEIRIGDDFFGDDWDGQVAGIKLFDDNLTLAEIRNEMSTYVPKFLQKAAPINLASWWPVLAGSAGERIRDYSGNGNDFTENGNPSDASVDPGISWGAESVYIGQVVVAPTGTGVMLLDAATLAGVGVMLPSGTGVIVIDAAVIAATGVGALVIGPPDHRGLLRPPGRLLH